MLVLTRKIGEGIAIGPNVRVVVIEIQGGQVRLGIEAPSHVPVHRDEVYTRMVDENQRAASTAAIPTEVLARLRSRKA